MQFCLHSSQAVAEYTRTAPDQRVRSLMGFANRMGTTAKVQEELAKWNLKFSAQLEKIQGRTLRPEKILQGMNKSCTYAVDNADWGNALR